jgi:hypothetical protein
MIFVFPPNIQAGIASGAYEVVKNSSGVVLGLARDKATGQFVGHAVGTIGEPFLAIPKLLLGTVQMVQVHQGFQKTYRELDVIKDGLQNLQASIGVLQATTAVIGVGTVVGVVLSAVNLQQTLKLREDIKQLRLEVKDGFIDLKQALKDQGSEIITRIEQVAQDMKFEQHRLVLIRAYGLFTQALKCFQSAMKFEDATRRYAQIDAVRGMLYQALADYTNPHLLDKTCSAGRLRRFECAWVINQAIIATYQVQNELSAASDQLTHLQDQIRQDSLIIIECCNSQDELDFLFPELARIQANDLAVIESWQNHTDWVHKLSPSEKEMLANSEIITAENSEYTQALEIITEPPEQTLYEDLKQKSHYSSLRDQLRFGVKPDLRKSHESYINQQAMATNLKALAPSNWQEIPDLTVANLYHYFKEKQTVSA